MRDGVSPSYVWLPAGEWKNLLSFLTERFPDVTADTWLARMNKGEVVDEKGVPLHANTAYRRGMCIYYYREIDRETPIPFAEHIVYQDEHILVADKPHFLPVTPSGRFLQETLLVRLKKQTGYVNLTPIHRIDRETAGIVIFSHNAVTRGRYQSLFQRREMRKVYEAIAGTSEKTKFPLVRRSRVAEGSHFFSMREVEGEPNTETHIDVLERRGDVCLYRLEPITGRKHQLRVHMAALGIPILNDAFYPTVLPCKGDDMTRPLKLLAKSIAFQDPVTGHARHFESRRNLW